MQGKIVKDRKKKLRRRVCDRCDKDFNSYARRGKYCEGCKIKWYERK